MSSDPVSELVKNFLVSSRSSIDTLVREVAACEEIKRDRVTLFVQEGISRREQIEEGTHFFIRTSVEYSSPQLTLEELQGIIAARLLEVCANHLLGSGVRTPDHNDVNAMVEALRRRPSGKIIPFILQTDDVEPDRYSNNPLRKSLIESGQGAFPTATLLTNGLKFDLDFLARYEGSLITKEEVDFGELHLADFERYVDFVDFYKMHELAEVETSLSIDLSLPMLRMPIEPLKQERNVGLLHAIIEEGHKDYETIEKIYGLMGRSIKKKTLLLTVPHSPKGYGSKRCARGKLVFSGQTLSKVRVRYQTTNLYPNMANPNDTSVAQADDEVEIDAQRLMHYAFMDTPSSPQFALYIVLSPEDASLWHGVGQYAGSDILRSYSSVQSAFLNNEILEVVPRPKICKRPPIAFNLVPEKMWAHPKYKNIDASVNCLPSLRPLLNLDTKVTSLCLRRDPGIGMEPRTSESDSLQIE